MPSRPGPLDTLRRRVQRRVSVTGLRVVGADALFESRPPDAIPPVAADLWKIYRLARRVRPRRVLEFGSGCSTAVFALALEKNGGDGRVTSIETDPRWAEVTRQSIPAELRERVSVVDASVVVTEQWDDPVFLHDPLPDETFDFIYLDGPALLPCVKGAGDVLLIQQRTARSVPILVDGRNWNVDFLVRHLDGDYRVDRDEYFNRTLLTPR